MLDIFSLGRAGPSRPFTRREIQQISRTVRHVPEVMVKVTGGGTSTGAVAAHLSYISRGGKLTIETDNRVQVGGKDEQKALLQEWHLELSAGQYRGSRDGKSRPRRTKLVHTVVLSMPASTPPEKVLKAARSFARDKFRAHRYAMVLHTDHEHPHVHMVVKAEDEFGQRLHIDKQMLRQWREDFARLMREQGIAANATPRVSRGRHKGTLRDGRYRAQRRGKSTGLRAEVTDIVRQIHTKGTFSDPARSQLVESRKSVVALWTRIAEALDKQGEIGLASDVRQFVQHLPKTLTQKEVLAARYVKYLQANEKKAPRHKTQSFDRTL